VCVLPGDDDTTSKKTTSQDLHSIKMSSPLPSSPASTARSRTIPKVSSEVSTEEDDGTANSKKPAQLTTTTTTKTRTSSAMTTNKKSLLARGSFERTTVRLRPGHDRTYVGLPHRKRPLTEFNQGKNKKYE